MNELKLEFFESLFEHNAMRYSTAQDGKYATIEVNCKNDVLRKHMLQLYRKYKGSQMSFDEIQSEYQLWAWKAIERFEIEDGSSWEDILDGLDSKNFNKLIKNIKTTCNHEIYRFCNPDAKFTRGELDGVKGQHITLKIQVESLDAILFDEDKNIHDFVTDNDNVFNNFDDEYHVNYFHKWFEENKEDILTKSQLKLLKDLRKAKRVEGYTINDVEKYTGVPSNKINTRLKRISDRIKKRWCLEDHSHIKNRLELERDEKIEMLTEFVLMVEDSSNLETQNLRLSNWFKKYHNNTLVMDLMDSVTTQLETIMVNKFLKGQLYEIKAKTLYKFLEAVNNEIAKLKAMDCTVKKVEVAKNKKEKHEKYNQVVTVTNVSGEVIRKDIDVKKRAKSNIVYVLPSGARVETKGVLSQ